MSPIDPRIPLQVRDVQVLTPLEQSARVAELQGTQLEQQAKIKALKDQEAIQQVFQQHVAQGGDPTDLSPVLGKVYGINPMLGIQMQRQMEAERAAKAKAKAEAEEATLKHLDVIGKHVQSVLSLPETEQQRGYEAMLGDLSKRGILGEGELPPVFDRVALSHLAQGVRAAKENGLHVLTNVVDPESGETGTIVTNKEGFYRAGDKPTKSTDAKLGSFEDYVARYAAEKGVEPEKLTAPQIEDARKRFQQADDKPRITVNTADKPLTPFQRMEQTRKLRNDFQRETKAAQTVQQQLALMESSLKAVKSGSAPAGSQGVLVTFQKILDPTSVVRESEYERSGAGLPLMSALQGQWMRIVEGGAKVPVHELEKFVALARQFAAGQKRFADQSREQINSFASEFGLNKDLITRDIGLPNEPAAPAAPAQGGGVPTYQEYLRRKGR